MKSFYGGRAGAREPRRERVSFTLFRRLGARADMARKTAGHASKITKILRRMTISLKTAVTGARGGGESHI